MLRLTLVLAGLLPFLQDARLPELAASEFKSRRLKLMKELGEGYTILASRKPHDRFRVEWPTDPAPGSRVSFFYLVGRNYAEGRLFLRHSDLKVILFCDDAARARKETGIEDVRPAANYEPFVKEEFSKAARIFTDAKGSYTTVIKESNEEVEIVTDAFHQLVTRMREIKNDDEMRMMRKAADASCKAHVKAMLAARPDVNERTIQDTFIETLKAEGCDGLSYPCIVGGSANTPVIHYNANDKPVKGGELILNDSAGSYRGYACDITRTWPVSGKFTDLQRKQYQAVLDAQKAAEKLLKPGVTWGELHRAAAGAISDAGFADVSYAKFHGLGHFVGLQTHDTGRYREPLKEGAVITIEPGIYDKGNLISIRIEDMYLVTRDGFERFSSTAPREIDEIEKLMASH